MLLLSLASELHTNQMWIKPKQSCRVPLAMTATHAPRYPSNLPLAFPGPQSAVQLRQNAYLGLSTEIY